MTFTKNLLMNAISSKGNSGFFPNVFPISIPYNNTIRKSKFYRNIQGAQKTSKKI